MKIDVKLTGKQVWAIIIIALGLLIVNGVLVYGLFTKEIELDKTCPVPKDEVGVCECFYNALGDKDLRYCFCYPGNEILDLDKLLSEGLNGSIRNS